MGQLTTLLESYFEERGTQSRVAERGGIDKGNLSRIVNGELGVTLESIGQIVRGFDGHPEQQAALLAAHLFDHVPTELRGLVEIVQRPNGVKGIRRELFKPQADEMERALSRIRRAMDHPTIKKALLAIADTADVVEEVRHRAQG